MLSLEVSGVSNATLSVEVASALPDASEIGLTLSKMDVLSDTIISDVELSGRAVLSNNPSVELSGSMVVVLMISDEAPSEGALSDVAISLRRSVVLSKALSAELLCDEISSMLPAVVENSIELSETASLGLVDDSGVTSVVVSVRSSTELSEMLWELLSVSIAAVSVVLVVKVLPDERSWVLLSPGISEFVSSEFSSDVSAALSVESPAVGSTEISGELVILESAIDVSVAIVLSPAS